MPAILALLGGLLSFAKPLVGRVLLALGMGYVTYRGMQISLDFLQDEVRANMAQFPPLVLDFVAFLWVDKAISVVFSASSAALALKLVGGKMTKLVVKPPVG